MYVCICRQITDHQIRDVCRDGATSLHDVRSKLGVAADCGKCGKLAKNIVKEYAKSTPYINAG